MAYSRCSAVQVRNLPLILASQVYIILPRVRTAVEVEPITYQYLPLPRFAYTKQQYLALPPQTARVIHSTPYMAASSTAVKSHLLFSPSLPSRTQNNTRGTCGRQQQQQTVCRLFAICRSNYEYASLYAHQSVASAVAAAAAATAVLV